MRQPIRVVQYGLGPIGLATIDVLLEKQAAGFVHVVGAIDIDPEKVGRDVAALLHREEDSGVVVSFEADRVLAEAKPDVVLHTTSSFLENMHYQLEHCAMAGAHVISSTEELSFPFERHPELATRLDLMAREHGTVILGTGVNPGYAMDTLVLTATGACTDVRRIAVERVVDAAERRMPLQRKVGAGLSVQAFEDKKATGTFGHIGLRESLLMVAAGLGWTFDRIEESLQPVVAHKNVETPYLRVEPGQTAGIHHAITGYVHGEVLVSLDLQMYVGADDPRDAIRVEGTPPIDLVVRGGIFGDSATVAALVNAIPLVMDAAPGLRTTMELPVPRCFGPGGIHAPVTHV